MYLANWQSMNSSTILSQGHHPENFPYWKFSLSSGDAVFAHCWTIFHVVPNYSIFFTAFWIYFLAAHLLLPRWSAALNSFQNSPLEIWSFSMWNVLVFLVIYCMENVNFFNLCNCRLLLFINFPDRNISVSNAETAYLVGVRLTLEDVSHGIEIFLCNYPSSRWYFKFLRKLTKTFFFWAILSGNRKSHRQMLKLHKSFPAYCKWFYNMSENYCDAWVSDLVFFLFPIDGSISKLNGTKSRASKAL